jgi:RNA polymerase sigma-70 factor (ECF subfamily)
MEITFSPIQHALLQGCINRNRVSQKELYKILSPTIYTLILRQGFLQIEAEEILQRVFIEIFNSIEHYNHHVSFKDWYLDVFDSVLGQSKRDCLSYL